MAAAVRKGVVYCGDDEDEIVDTNALILKRARVCEDIFLISAQPAGARVCEDELLNSAQPTGARVLCDPSTS